VQTGRPRSAVKQLESLDESALLLLPGEQYTRTATMHCVNLAVQDSLEAVSFMRDFLALIGDLISFLRHSPKDRCATLRQIAVDLDCPRTFIRPLCPTHFTVRHRAIDGVKR